MSEIVMNEQLHVAVSDAITKADEEWQGLSDEDRIQRVGMVGKVVDRVVETVPDKVKEMGIDPAHAKFYYSEQGGGGTPSMMQRFKEDAARVAVWVEAVADQVAGGEGKKINEEMVTYALIEKAIMDPITPQTENLSLGQEAALVLAGKTFKQAQMRNVGKGHDSESDLVKLAPGLIQFALGVVNGDLEKRMGGAKDKKDKVAPLDISQRPMTRVALKRDEMIRSRAAVPVSTALSTSLPSERSGEDLPKQGYDAKGTPGKMLKEEGLELTETDQDKDGLEDKLKGQKTTLEGVDTGATPEEVGAAAGKGIRMEQEHKKRLEEQTRQQLIGTVEAFLTGSSGEVERVAQTEESRGVGEEERERQIQEALQAFSKGEVDDSTSHSHPMQVAVNAGRKGAETGRGGKEDEASMMIGRVEDEMKIKELDQAKNVLIEGARARGKDPEEKDEGKKSFRDRLNETDPQGIMAMARVIEQQKREETERARGVLEGKGMDDVTLTLMEPEQAKALVAMTCQVERVVSEGEKKIPVKQMLLYLTKQGFDSDLIRKWDSSLVAGTAITIRRALSSQLPQ